MTTPGGPLSVRWLRSSLSPFRPCPVTIRMSPIGLIDSVRSSLSGSCRSIVTSPLTWRSAMVALIGAGGGEPLHLAQVLLAAERGARLRHQLFGLRIAGHARREAAGGHRERHQIHNHSLHVITSLKSMTTRREGSCYLWAIVL